MHVLYSEVKLGVRDGNLRWWHAFLLLADTVGKEQAGSLLLGLPVPPLPPVPLLPRVTPRCLISPVDTMKSVFFLGCSGLIGLRIKVRRADFFFTELKKRVFCSVFFKNVSSEKEFASLHQTIVGH